MFGEVFWPGILALSLALPNCWANTYKDKVNQMDKIPFNEIPTDISKIFFKENDLIDIDFFPNTFTSLTIITLMGHPRITYFPNFVNVSSTLSELYIKECSVRTVNEAFLQALVNLKLLDLRKNQLLSPFPDMDATRGCSLWKLQLNENRLSEVPHLPVIARTLNFFVISSNENMTSISRETLALYQEMLTFLIHDNHFKIMPDFSALAEKHTGPSLSISLKRNGMTTLTSNAFRHATSPNWIFHLGTNQISRIPNMIHLGVQASVELDENPVVCDCGMQWMKIAGQYTGFNLSLITCAGPGSVSGRNLSDVGMEELVCEQGR